jgi:tetratricopeptide (TPR) repeat protein
VLLLASVLVQLQGQPLQPIRGEVITAGEGIAQDWQAELFDLQRNMPLERVAVQPNGSFEFRVVTNATVELRILDEHSAVIGKEFVNPAQGQFGVTMRVNGDRKLNRPVNGTVSVYRLSHKVPKKAMKFYRESEKAFAKKDMEAAIEKLRKAVVEDPGFMEAHNNLGTRYMQTQQPLKAVECFRRAAELDPSTPAIHVNLAIALMHARQPAEAELHIRRALERDNSKTVQDILMMTLRAQGKPVNTETE